MSDSVAISRVLASIARLHLSLKPLVRIEFSDHNENRLGDHSVRTFPFHSVIYTLRIPRDLFRSMKYTQLCRWGLLTGFYPTKFI